VQSATCVTQQSGGSDHLLAVPPLAAAFFRIQDQAYHVEAILQICAIQGPGKMDCSQWYSLLQQKLIETIIVGFYKLSAKNQNQRLQRIKHKLSFVGSACSARHHLFTKHAANGFDAIGFNLALETHKHNCA
jgi:hypothetical protein